MDAKDLTLEGIIFVVFLLLSMFVLKLSDIASIIIGFVGFGIFYYLLKIKNK
jgi:uncharacterized membrane-anchored protein